MDFTLRVNIAMLIYSLETMLYFWCGIALRGAGDQHSTPLNHRTIALLQ